MDIKIKDFEYIARTYKRNDVCFVRGEGSHLYDDKGAEYIDFASGIAVNGLGYGNKKWVEAVQAQVETLAHVSNLYYTEPCALLAEQLCLRTGLKRVFFCNSGAEANECAIKAARKRAVALGKTASPEVISLRNSFHGRTMLTLTATGQDELHKDCFAPYPQGLVWVEPKIEDVHAAINENTAAVIVELIQGEGGVNTLSKEFARNLESLCREKDILLIVDEVQTGNGRTGTLYAFQGYEMHPDIVTTAKGLGNGLPIGAVMFSDKADVFEAGDHGSTFGGNPIAAAGALAVLEQIDEKLLSEVVRKGEMLKSELGALPSVKSVSGMGLMLGIEVDNATEVVKKCLDSGLVVLTAHGKVRLLPPLNIEEKDLKKGIKILSEVLV